MKPTKADYAQLHLDIEKWLKGEDVAELEEANDKLTIVAQFCVNFLSEGEDLPPDAQYAIAALYNLIDGDKYYFLEEEEEEDE